MELQLWVKNHRATCEAAAKVHRGAPLYRRLPLFVSPPPPTLAVCHFSTNCLARSRLLCCRLRAALMYHLAHGHNLRLRLPADDCISGSRAQELVAVLLKHHAAQRAPVFPPPRTVYEYPRVYEIPPPLPLPPPAPYADDHGASLRESKCARPLLLQPPCSR